VHALVSPILVGATWHDPFGTNAESNPPHRQTRQASRSQRRKGWPIVGSDCIWKAKFTKDVLEGLPHWLSSRAVQGLTAKQVPAESVGDGERIASLTPNRKVSLEVGAPD